MSVGEGGGVRFCFMGQQIVASQLKIQLLLIDDLMENVSRVYSFFFDKRLIYKWWWAGVWSKNNVKREIDIKIIKQSRNCSYFEEAKKNFMSELDDMAFIIIWQKLHLKLWNAKF